MMMESSDSINQSNSEYRYVRITGVRLRGISSVVERETAQTAS